MLPTTDSRARPGRRHRAPRDLPASCACHARRTPALHPGELQVASRIIDLQGARIGVRVTGQAETRGRTRSPAPRLRRSRSPLFSLPQSWDRQRCHGRHASIVVLTDDHATTDHLAHRADERSGIHASHALDIIARPGVRARARVRLRQPPRRPGAVAWAASRRRMRLRQPQRRPGAVAWAASRRGHESRWRDASAGGRREV